MIEIYQGRIGGGKSYASISRIAQHLAVGGWVYSNIEINPEGMAKLLAKKYGVEFDPDSYLPLPDQVWGWQEQIFWGTRSMDVLVVIDEAQVFYNSRDWQRTANEHARMLTFLTQSRKACVSVIFVTQHAENIDKQFRLLSQNFWTFRDMGKFGPLAPFMGFCFLAVARDYVGEPLGTRLVPKSKLIFGAYDTLAFLDSQMREMDQDASRRIEPRRVVRVGLFKRYFGRRYLIEKRTHETDRDNSSPGAPRVVGMG